VDVGGAAHNEAVVERVAERVDPGALPVARLVGVPDVAVDADLVSRRLAERFGFARIEDASTFHASARLDRIAEDDTVAGHVVRLGRRRIGEARDEAHAAIAERALRIALHSLGVT
jgi:hypothetical protein